MEHLNTIKSNLEKLESFSTELNGFFEKSRSLSLFRKMPLKDENQTTIDRLREGYYLLRSCGIEFNESECNRLAIELLELLKLHLKDKEKDISYITAAFMDEKIKAHDLIFKTFKNEGNEIRKVINRQNLPEDLVTFYLVYLARPFREQAAAYLMDGINEFSWSFGYCPVCGHWPSLGHIKTDDGHRTLWCLQCNNKWDYKRIQCVFCMTEIQKHLELISIENEEIYRVQVCKKCKRYLKEVRSSIDPGNFPFDKIYMGTLPLDLIAHQEEYIQESMLTVRYENADGNELLMYRQDKFSKEIKTEPK